jgi:hypothetical protein
MKAILTAGVALAALTIAAPAMADSINFAQYGAPGTGIGSGATGVTAGGDQFTISDVDQAGFSEYCEDKTRQCTNNGYTWAGEFYKGEVILFNNSAPSPVTIDFAHGLNSVTDLQAQANLYGAFTETLVAYSGNTIVDTVSAAWFNGVSNPPGEGTIPKLSVFGRDITSIEIYTTNDGAGFALGGVGGVNNVPEPGTLALFGAGLLGLAGFASRRRKTTSA